MNKTLKNIGNLLAYSGFFTGVFGYIMLGTNKLSLSQFVFVGYWLFVLGLAILSIRSLIKSLQIRKNGKKDSFSIVVNVLMVFYVICGIFALSIISIGNYTFKTSKAYNVATQEIIENNKYEDQIGEIYGFGLITTGSLSSENAEIFFRVRAEKKNPKIKALLERRSNGSWEIIEISGIE